MNILGGDILQIDLINAGTDSNIAGHLRRSGDIVHSQIRAVFEQCIIPGGAVQFIARNLHLAHGIDLGQSLLYLEQSYSSRNPIGFQRRGDGQADRFIGAASVSYHKVGSQRIQASLDTFYGSVKRFQVDGNVASAPQSNTHPFRRNMNLTIIIIEQMFAMNKWEILDVGENRLIRSA